MRNLKIPLLVAGCVFCVLGIAYCYAVVLDYVVTLTISSN